MAHPGPTGDDPFLNAISGVPLVPALETVLVPVAHQPVIHKIGAANYRKKTIGILTIGFRGGFSALFYRQGGAIQRV